MFLFLTSFLSIFFLPGSLYARLENLETTRLKSTAGTGVGSILLDESTLLNPAPLAFFKNSTFLFQKTSFTPRNKTPGQGELEPYKYMGFILSDARGRLKGSLSYQDQREHLDTRKRFAASLASLLGIRSAVGVTYRYTKDYENSEKKIYRQITVGVLHSINQELSLGLIIQDPFNVRPVDRMAVIGAQYVYKNFISLLLDIGADYMLDLRDTLLYRSAIQFKILDDFFLRFGTFSDRKHLQNGTGIGLSWNQPKLIFALALNNNYYKIKKYSVHSREISFSIAYRL